MDTQVGLKTTALCDDCLLVDSVETLNAKTLFFIKVDGLVW